MKLMGAKGGGKSGGDAARVAVEAPDSLRSRQFARVLDLICEGEIEGLVNGLKSIYLDDTPLQAADDTMNFSGVTLDTRNGTQAQTYIPGFEAQETEVSVGVEVTNATPVVRTITDADTDSVRVTLNLPALTYQNTTNGDLSGYTVEIAIDIQANGGGYVAQNLAGMEIISGKTRSNYQRSYRLALTGSAPWDIRVRRISADTAVANIQDKTFWSSYTSIIEKKLTHPNSALVGLSVDSAHFGTVPKRSYLMKLMRIRIPANYNPVTRVYTGVWDGTFTVAWSDNPAWCYYDLLTSKRYGLGNYVPENSIDKWSLYTIGQYCDELVPDGKGGTEPRFTCNLLLQRREEAFKVINDFASVFRGMAYWASGSVYAVQDAPSTPKAIFNQSNVVDGMFHREGSGRKARHTAVTVMWNDPADRYKQKPEYVEDEEGVLRFGLRQTDVVAFGCASQGQAHRVGRWLLYTERYESEVISFTTGLEASFLRPGDLALVVDPSRSNERWGGRILAATLSTITLDGSITILDSILYTISLVMPDGSVIDRSLAPVAQGSYSEVSVTVDLPTSDLIGVVWVVSSENIEAETIRVLTTVEESPGLCKVIGVQHNATKFDAIESNLTLQVQTTSNLRYQPLPVTNLEGSEYLYKNSGAVLTKLVISFDTSLDAAFYDISYRKDSGNEVKIPRTSSTHVEVMDVSNGVYDIQVIAVSAAGVSSIPATTLHTVLGKEGIPPSNVASLLVEIEPQGLKITHPEIDDLDRLDYEVRRGASWDAGAINSYGHSSANYRLERPLPSGTYTFWVKARDTSLNESTDATSFVLVVPVPGIITFKAGANIVGADVRIEWNVPTTYFAISGYEIRYGDDFDSGTSLGNTLSTAFQMPAIWLGTRTFWIAAVDSVGNVGAVGSKEVQVLAPNATVITSQVIDNNVLLYWNAADRTLPIREYEVRKGAVYASAVVVGTKKGLFTSLLETAEGNYTYWITGIDTAGNYGTPASIVSFVNEPPDYILRADIDSALGGTLSNAYFEAGTVVLPVDVAETYQQHFVNNAWADPDDQITAGYPIYIQPAEASGYYEETIDYGTVLAGSKITLTPNLTLLNSPTIVYTISYKTLIGDAWTDYVGTQVFATNFRYLKIKIAVTSTGDDLVTINAINIRLDSKLKTITRTVAVGASGTTIYLTDDQTITGNKLFVDVDAIQVTPLGTTSLTGLYDFVDTPDPLDADIYVFNSVTGAGVAATASVTIRGF